jgi:hypothetical protein
MKTPVVLLQVSKEGSDIIESNISIQTEFIEVDFCEICATECNERVRYKACGHSNLRNIY